MATREHRRGCGKASRRQRWLGTQQELMPALARSNRFICVPPRSTQVDRHFEVVALDELAAGPCLAAVQIGSASKALS
ncbi:hypothetical protein B8W66_01940 [Mycobacterium decipiens]|uniref:Uncharacterized protein n=1 Tax=Mycobacterium decipiens TaxID=1430326 RepID=A0A1X2M0K6_9MYCO|nr:hypothetical protein B8W66_01940 [Mycobacterium decipiens]